MTEKPKTWSNILDDMDIDDLKKSCKGRVESIAVLGLLYTGMRVSEFLHFRKDWIDIRKGGIFIPKEQSCSCVECKYRREGVWKTKTEHARRFIPLIPEVEVLFREYFNEYDAILDTYKDRREIWRIVKRVGDRADIKNKKVFPHSLRGSFASILASKGFSVQEIIGALGWLNAGMFQKYIRVPEGRMKKAFDEKW